MEKCRDCNGTLMKDELKCFNCGRVVQTQDSAQTVFGKRFSSFLNVAFIASALLTVASLFFDFTPPFMRCLMLTVLLLLVRSSAAQMMEKKKS
jgi:polyferredoxin